MGVLSLTGETRSSDTDSLPATIALTASGLLAALACLWLDSRRLSLFGAAAVAAVWVIIHLAATFLILLAVFAYFGRRFSGKEHIVALAFIGIWFAPVCILLTRHSWWLIPAAVCLSLAVAALAGKQTTAPTNRFIEALALQTGATAALAGFIGIASLFIALTCYRIAQAMEPSSRRIKLRAPMAAAIALTAMGLLPYGRQLVRADAAPGPGITANRPDMVSGVVLKPKRPKHVMIVAPPSNRRNAVGRGLVKPLVIPFTGEYWLFHWPMRQPPKSSMVEYGEPNEFKFTVPGLTRLNMEARQTLGLLLNVDCCRAIELDLSNSDPFPGTVSLQVLLANTSTPAVRLPLGELEAPPTGKLRFEMPGSETLREFDQLIVVYRLRPPRVHRSANISIESFSLIPR